MENCYQNVFLKVSSKNLNEKLKLYKPKEIKKKIVKVEYKL